MMMSVVQQCNVHFTAYRNHNERLLLLDWLVLMVKFFVPFFSMSLHLMWKGLLYNAFHYFLCVVVDDDDCCEGFKNLMIKMCAWFGGGGWMLWE